MLNSGDLLGRIDGDELTVCAPSAPVRRSAEVLAQQLADALDQPFGLSGQEVFLNIGISLYPNDGTDPRHPPAARRSGYVSGQALEQECLTALCA
ncbi:MAG: hypothetical protein JWQ08_1595 [Deinococcus sp.]|nr:hypothetical protein [Deinococcus sp.]